MKKFAYVAAALLSTTAAPAMAAPIIYTISGNFSGFTDGGTFTNQFATFTGTGDTSTATNGAFGIPSYVSVALSTFTAFQPSISTTYTITSPGTFGIYKASDIAPGNTTTRLGFIFDNNGSNGFALESDAFNGYSGLTSFAPTGGNVYYETASFNTDLGRINITNFENATFSAALAAVPEPATWAMMILGFGVVGAAMRRRQSTVRVAYA